MAEKQKKITITTDSSYKRTAVLPEGAYVQVTGNYLIAYTSSWRSSEPPIFQVDLSPGDMYQIEDLSEDEEIIEKVKKLSKDEMNTLRNIMDSTGLL